MDAAAPRPSSPSLFAWLATGLTVATLVLDRLLPRTASTGPERLGTVCLLASAPLILLPFRDLRRHGHPRAGGTYMDATVVADRGIYAVVRHPQYLGYGLLVAGFGLKSGHPAVLAAGAAAIVAFVLQARREEAALRARFGETWEAYARRVPRFNLAAGLVARLRRAGADPGPGRKR